MRKRLSNSNSTSAQVIPSQNKQITLNLALAIIRVALSIASAPLLVRSVGLTSGLNFYYAASALTTALFSVAMVPVEIHYSPGIASALKPGSAEVLRHLIEKKIGASTLLLSLPVAAIILYQLATGLIGTHKLGEVEAWIYLACFVNSWIQYQLAQVATIMRLEKRQISANYCSVFGISASSLFPLLIIPYHGLMGYIAMSVLLAAILSVILSVRERLDIRNILSFKPDKSLETNYIRLIKMSIFTKGFAIAESAAISIFALKDSTLYFLAKKVVSQFLSVVLEGRIRFLESDIIHAIGNRDNTLALSTLRSNSKLSTLVCLCYICALAICAPNSFSISQIMKITPNQVHSALFIAAILVAWLYSSVTGIVIGSAFYSLDLVIKNRFFLACSATVWAMIALIATFTFGPYGTALSVGGYYMFNNFVITKKVALALS